jgi:Tfp pilus assembly pilus retraction ATPase PilT
MSRFVNLELGDHDEEFSPAADRTRRVPAHELLRVNNAVRSIIRENQLHMLDNVLQTGGREGMVMMDNGLYDPYCRCLITYDTAMSSGARNRAQLQPHRSPPGQHLIP